MSALDQALLQAVQQPVSAGMFGKVFAFAQVMTPLPDAQDWYDLPLATRDRRLMSIRAEAFGPDFAGTVLCTQCSECIEFSLDIRSFIQLPATDSHFHVHHENESYLFRPLCTRDLVGHDALENGVDSSRLVKDLSLDDQRVAEAVAEHVEIIKKVNDVLEKNQEASDIVLQSVCPECGTPVGSIFDIVHVLDDDITSNAALFLEEIHQLASAYGWTEQEIFSLPRARRSWYVKRIRVT